MNTKEKTMNTKSYNYIKQGDCLELLKDIPDNSIDLIVTDPPYDISATNRGGTVNNIKKMRDSLLDLKQTQDITNGYDIELYNEEFIRVMKEINIYIFCNKAQIYNYMQLYIGKHNCKFDIITWHKQNALPTYSNKYLSDTEYCLYFHKGKGKCFPKNYEYAKTYYIGYINHKDKKTYGHPTIKPLDLIEKLICNSSKENDIVLDPFIGSGTTAVACINNNRRYIGFEINKQYYEIANKRIQESNQNNNLF